MRPRFQFQLFSPKPPASKLTPPRASVSNAVANAPGCSPTRPVLVPACALPLPYFYLGLCVLFSLLEAFIYLAAELVPLKTVACVKLSTPHRQPSVLQKMPKPWATVPACLILTTEWSRSIHLGVSPPPPKIKQNKHLAGPLHLQLLLASVFVLLLFFPNHPNKGPCSRHPAATTI